MPTTPDPDATPQPDPDDIIAPVREFLQSTEPRLEELRARGLDLTDFLADCRRFLAAQHTGADDWFDSAMLLQRLAEVRDETQSYHDLQGEADRISARAGIPKMLEGLATMIPRFRRGDPDDHRVADTLEAALTTARARLAAGEDPVEQLEDITLTLRTRAAEHHRRHLIRTAATAIYWELQSPEWHADLPEPDREKIATLLQQWRRERETHLSQLPLEDRHRLESLRLEDFTSPGKLKP